MDNDDENNNRLSQLSQTIVVAKTFIEDNDNENNNSHSQLPLSAKIDDDSIENVDIEMVIYRNYYNPMKLFRY